MKTVPKITYYDFNHLIFSGFFLTGLVEHAKLSRIRFEVSKLVPPILEGIPTDARWRRILFSVCVFRYEHEGNDFFFCIDTRDSSHADPERGNGYLLPLLEKVRFYFKVNYNEDAIREDCNLSRYSGKIVPVLPYCAIKPPALLPLLTRFLPNRKVGWTPASTTTRYLSLYTLPTLRHMRLLRELPRDRDIVFLSVFYKEAVHAQEMESRARLFNELRKQNTKNSLIGFVGRRRIPRPFGEFQIEAHGFSLKGYLRTLAASRIAIYVRGVHQCISSKFGQYLALGKPIIGEPIINNAKRIMNNRYFEEQFAFNDPGEIAFRAKEMLENPERLQTIGRSNADIFDTRFSPQAVIGEILEHLGRPQQPG